MQEQTQMNEREKIVGQELIEALDAAGHDVLDELMQGRPAAFGVWTGEEMLGAYVAVCNWWAAAECETEDEREGYWENVGDTLTDYGQNTRRACHAAVLTWDALAARHALRELQA